MWQRLVFYALAISVLTTVSANSLTAGGNPLAYLDENNPWYPHTDFPKLTTPQWVGEDGVEAVVVLAIDDMRDPAKYEAYLRPILQRLKAIDGRAPVSIMTCNVRPDDPQLQIWLEEGLSIDVHTVDHPCPLLQGGDFARAKSTYDRCIDRLHQIPGNRPVAFRMPCCDSLNTVSPRFFSEIFNSTTPEGNYLRISSSVFTVFTADDQSIPRELVLNEDGSERFRRYLPKGLKRGGVEHNHFLNWIENYPYPYIINGRCWEFPCVVPSDWSAQFLQQPNNPKTVEDWKAALDITVHKQGVFNLVFHPHGWIRAEQVVELIDHAVEKHGKKVRFLTFREALDRLDEALPELRPRRPDADAQARPVLVDVNKDGYLDVLNERHDHSGGRLWNPQQRTWNRVERTQFELPKPETAGRQLPEGARLVDLNGDGHRDLIVSNVDVCRISLWNVRDEDWTDTVLEQNREFPGGRRLPLIVNEDGSDNGFFVHSGSLVWQNETTDHLPDLVYRVSVEKLLAEHERRQARAALPPVPVGAARIDITPEYPVRMTGYGSRMKESEGIAQRLHARALAIGGSLHAREEFSETPLTVLLTVDNCGVPASVTEKVHARLAETLELRREHFAVSATHTHSGPWLMDFAPNIFPEIPDEHRQRLERYETELIEKLVRVAEQAVGARRPGRLAVTQGTVRFARNRRVLQDGQWKGFGVQEDGPVDHRLPLLAARDTDGKLIAVLATYACHCTTETGAFNQISGDWAGFAARMIEQDHPDAVALISIGAGADANPEPRGTHELSRQHGRELADEVKRLLQDSGGLQILDPRIVARMARVDLPLGPLPLREEWEQRAKEGGTRGSHARRFLEMLERGEPVPTTVPDYPVQTWCFGEDLAMVFLGGEVVVDYALRLNDTFDGDRLWLNAYSNDVPCYIASKRVLQEGGYEADFSMIYYARPTRLAPEAEDIIVDTVQKLLPPEFYSEQTQQDFPAPKSPEESAACIQVKPGLKVELVAAEPLVTDPVAFDWDIQGRLWVVEMGDYPGQAAAGGEGQAAAGGERQPARGQRSGRIRVLTDVDGDGRYDEATTFLDGVAYPTGICRWRNGVLVTAAPDIFYAEDTDGDGRADLKQTLYRGFSEGNQQHRVNGLRWGLDGWVHVGNGDSGGEITAVGRGLQGGRENPDSVSQAVRVSVNGRDLRIRPDTGDLQTTSGQTQFGRARDDWGNWFGNNNSNPIWHYVLDEKYLRRNPHAPVSTTKAMIAVVPGAAPVFPVSRTLARFNDFDRVNRFTSACSTTIYRDSLLGEEFYGDAFVCEPVHNLVSRLVLTPSGVTFKAERSPNESDSEFFASRDNWSRPVMVRTGPDGALWVADMYRFVIEHPKWIPAEQQRKLDLYAGADRGRIYRISRESDPACCGAADAPVPPGAGSGQRSWCQQPWDKVSVDELTARLASPNGWWRDAAQRILTHRQDDQVTGPLQAMVRTHESPVARLQALCTLDGLNAVTPELLIDALADSHAGVRRHAIRLSEPLISQHPALLEAVLARAGDPDMRVQMQLAWTLGAVPGPEAGRHLGRLAVRHENNAWLLAAVFSSLSSENVTAALASVMEAGGTASSSGALAAKLIGQAAAFEQLDAVADHVVSVLESSGTPAGAEDWKVRTDVFTQVSRLPGIWKQLTGRRRIREQLAASMELALATALDRDAGEPARRAAIEFAGASGKMAGPDLERLAGLLVPQSPAAIQHAVVEAIALSSETAAAGLLLRHWKQHSPAVRGQVVDALLMRHEWTGQLLEAIENGDVAAADLDAVRRERLLVHPDAAVRKRARSVLANSVTETDRTSVVQSYLSVLELPADVVRGRKVFEKRCSACHRIGQIGRSIGADLTALRERSGEALLTAILDPNRAVEAKFLSYIAVTKQGRSFSGMLLSETGSSITLIGTDGKEQTLLRNRLDELVGTNRSLMPEGLEKDLSRQDIADVIAFVQSAGVKWKSFPGHQPRVIAATEDGTLVLPANAAEIYGPSLILEEKYGNLGWWSSTDDYAVWTIETRASGFYRVELEYACDDATSGSPIRFSTGTRLLTARVPGTGTWDEYRTWFAGEIDLRRGRQRMTVSAPVKPRQALIDLKSIRLIPADRR